MYLWITNSPNQTLLRVSRICNTDVLHDRGCYPSSSLNNQAVLLLWWRVASSTVLISSSVIVYITCSHTAISSGYVSSSFSGWYKSLNGDSKLMTGETVLNLSESGETIELITGSNLSFSVKNANLSSYEGGVCKN